MLHEDEITLANGCRLTIRFLRRGEESTLRELFARLSPRSRYLRFFSDMPVTPDSVVRLLADVDGIQRLALVAQLDQTHGCDVIALGNVAVGEGLPELGIVVADAWQRQGIGIAVIDRLLEAAEHRGHHRFMVHALYENPALRKLLDHVADVESTSTRHGVTEITFVRRRPDKVRRPPGVGAAVNATGTVDQFLEQAYERILANQGREAAKRRTTCL